MRTAEILAHGRENNFNAIRICAALAVIVSHSFPITLGPDAPEPLEHVLGFSLGALGVKVFFVISGFLILKSFMQRRSTASFAMARARRILPGLAVVGIVVAFVIGPLLTSLPVQDYLSDSKTALHVPRTISLFALDLHLPGLFQGNPIVGNVNGSLWTLPIEVECYAGLALAGLLGFYRPRLFPLVLVGFVPAYVVARYGLWAGHDLSAMAGLAFPFLLGMAAYFYRARLPMNVWLLLALTGIAAAAVGLDILREELSTVAIGYAGLWLGAADIGLLRSYNRIGDYSYGVYIYGWPMQQVLAQVLPGLSPLQMMVMAGLAALACGIVSWHLVEKPALNWRRTRPAADLQADKVEGDKTLQVNREGAYW